MKKLYIIVAVILLSAIAMADAIKIDVDALDRLSEPRNPTVKTTVSEVIPVTTIKTNEAFKAAPKMPSAAMTSQSMPVRSSSSREEAREEFIRALRDAIEKGKDFKYYFPNFDYGECKKDIEQMMRDAVSQ